MTTLAGGALPIPETTVQGTGSYIIPVDRYSKLIANTAASNSARSTYSGNMGGMATGGAAANNCLADLVSGDSITVQQATGSGTTNHGTTNTGTRTSQSYARILVNGVPISSTTAAAMSYVQGFSGTNPTVSYSTGYTSLGWTAAIYRIPKGNLPVGAAEGE